MEEYNIISVIVDLIEDSNFMSEENKHNTMQSVNRLMVLNNVSVHDLDAYYVSNGHSVNENGFAMDMDYAKKVFWTENLK